VVELGIVQGDDRLAERGGVTGVEGGVPLAVFVAETDDDDVGGTDQGLRADRVDAGPQVVTPEGRLLLAQGTDAGVVGRGVVGDRRRERDRQARLAGTRFDPLAPVGVDLAGEVDAPGSRGQVPCSSKCLLSIVTWPW